MIDNFKQAFQEEAREILVELETSLLELGERPDDAEIVGRAFRALHTIKGSGSMFGFEKLAAFTHNLETAFDEVRNGRLRVTSELINLSLSALDQIKALLEEGDAVSAATMAAAAEIVVKLQELTGSAQRNSEKEKQESAPAKPAAANPAQGPARDWRIHFAPGPDLLRTGANPLVLLGELKQLGATQITANLAAIPPLSELDPLRCYFSWDISLSTSAGRDAIRDVFIFVEDVCELAIEPVGEQAPERAAEQAPEHAAEQVRTAPKSVQEMRQNPGRRAYDTPDTASSIRVPAGKLDQFVDLVGELVTVQARLGEIASRSADQDVVTVSEEVERLTSALRESSMSIRMLPIRATFERFRRLVHDLARDLRKEVELTIEGAETELDKTVIDQLGDPLMHLIRNSMDHGIETPEARVAAGKDRTATVHLRARHSGGNVLVSVSDDGGGIDAEAVRQRGIEKGLISGDAQMTEAEVFSLIMAPGFSTAQKITDVSGRGVGMDVVRRNVEALRGSIDIQSKRGAGTSVTLRLPLTLAIIDGLLVRVAHSYFVLPLAITVECIELTREDVERANGKHIANVRGNAIPYIRLREYFEIRTGQPEREQIMIAETEAGRYGFVVDEVLGNHQTVIKNLGRFYRHVHIASGATILGNGMVALILDPNRLVQDVMRSMTVRPRAEGSGRARSRGEAGAIGSRAAASRELVTASDR